MKIIVKEFEIAGELENVFSLLYKDNRDAFWLDGNRVMEGLSRYSFMGCHPRFKVRVDKGCIHIMYSHHTETVIGDPFALLQQLVDQHHISSDKLPHIPFVGGFVGYFGFEMLKYIEKVPTRSNDYQGVAEGYWAFYDQVLIFDQVEQRATLTRLVTCDECEKDVEREVALHIERIKEAGRMKLDSINMSIGLKDIFFEQIETISSYINKVEKIKEKIAKGDIYQACFTHCFSTTIRSDPYRIYQVLRRINPAPFSCYLKIGDLAILSSSPERFLKLDLNGIVESRPIKGTRRRGEDKTVDHKLLVDLQSSEKDRAENVMIVDLVRNDLGRVCSQVRVPRLLQIESYATVHQLVSVVTGLLPEGGCPMDLIRATFPGGSMTGAPKVSALKTLQALEPVSRGIYSGGLGYLDVRGSFDLSMVIRTIVCKDHRATFHVGGGIVADSDPKDEYQESLDKAYALKRAITIAEQQV